MKYVTPEENQVYLDLAELLVTPERFGRAAECAGQLALFELERPE